MITFNHLGDNRLAINFNGTRIDFEMAEFDPSKFMAFKGLLHSPVITDFQLAIILDRAGLLSLVYKDTTVYFQMGNQFSLLEFPVGREAYSHLDRLLGLWLT